MTKKQEFEAVLDIVATELETCSDELMDEIVHSFADDTGLSRDEAVTKIAWFISFSRRLADVSRSLNKK